MKDWLTLSRTTGLLYLGLGVTGMVGFLFTGSELYVADDASATLSNLVDNPGLARLNLVAELGVVATQALLALWFFRLFRGVSSFAAGALAALGFMNAVAIMVGLVFTTTALQVALSSGNADTVQLLWDLHQTAWGVGGLFFGLWLIPMGYLAIRAKMPKLLGWLLYAGGIGYILSTIVYLAASDAKVWIDSLPILATFGEFWMIGYLLFKPLPKS